MKLQQRNGLPMIEWRRPARNLMRPVPAHGVPIVEQPQTSGCAAHFSIITGQEEEVSATFGRLSDLIVAATPE